MLIDVNYFNEDEFIGFGFTEVIKFIRDNRINYIVDDYNHNVIHPSTNQLKNIEEDRKKFIDLLNKFNNNKSANKPCGRKLIKKLNNCIDICESEIRSIRGIRVTGRRNGFSAFINILRDVKDRYDDIKYIPDTMFDSFMDLFNNDEKKKK